MNNSKKLEFLLLAKTTLNFEDTIKYIEKVEKAIKSENATTPAARMILKAKNQKYNKLVAKYQKITNAGGRHCEEVIKDIDDYTLYKLHNAGFDIEKVNKFGDYEVYKISWYGKEE